ncbi:MAG: gliding motility lipoprotein GldB [Paludibacteraceae bacterium]
MKIKLCFSFLILIIFSSCERKDRFNIDTTRNRVEVKIHRFDKNLIQLDTLNLQFSVRKLYSKYPAFLKTYISNMDTISPLDTPAVGKVLKNFVNYPHVKKINQEVLTTFAEVSGIESEISEAYTYLAFYFPQLKRPEVYFFVSGLSRPLIMDDNMDFIGIGSDFYLGADFEPYKSVMYEYMLHNMRPQSLSVDLVSAVLFNYFRFDSKENRLIDNMLHRGKVMYLLSVFMPEKKLQDIIGYTPEQWTWAEKNESMIWKTIISQKDLFSSDYQLIRRYLNDAPFTAPISQDSPGRLGTWIGMRIVKSYMDKNQNVTLQKLMQLNDYQKILEESGYKP